MRFEGADAAQPAPGVIESIAAAEAIIFAPSNPVTSIGPILAVPGIRDALRRGEGPGRRRESDCGRSGGYWPGRCVDEDDGMAKCALQALPKPMKIFSMCWWPTAPTKPRPSGCALQACACVCTNTIMKSMDDKRELARFMLEAALRNGAPRPNDAWHPAHPG